jgi:sugar lactone lactonase YvrE
VHRIETRGAALAMLPLVLGITSAGAQPYRPTPPAPPVTVVAGTGSRGCRSAGLSGSEATLNTPRGLVIDRNGDLLIANECPQRVVRLDRRTNRLSEVIGEAPLPIRMKGLTTVLSEPGSVELLAMDGAGKLYMAVNCGRRVEMFDTERPAWCPLAGLGGPDTFSGDSGPATEAHLEVCGLAVDAAGNVYVSGAQRIRRIAADTGVIETFAGTGRFGFFGDGGPARSADLAYPTALAIDHRGTIYFADSRNGRIRAIDSGGTIRTVAGSGSQGRRLDGDALREPVGEVQALAIDPDDNVVFMDSSKSIRRLDVRRGRVITILQGYFDELERILKVPGLAVGDDGTIYFDVPSSNRVQAIHAADVPREGS